MPFGLKNVGETYYKFVKKEMADKFGIIVDVYIDDMVVKTATEGIVCTTYKVCSLEWSRAECD